MRRAALLTFLLWYVEDDTLYKQSCVWKKPMNAVVSISVSFKPQFNIAMTEMLHVNCNKFSEHQQICDSRQAILLLSTGVSFNNVAVDLDYLCGDYLCGDA